MNGDELRTIRTKMQLTQASLAVRMGVVANTIARWERGELPINKTAEILLRKLTDENAMSVSESKLGRVDHEREKAD